MATQTKHIRYTVSEYGSLEQSSELKHEYIDGYVYAMVGDSRGHNLITGAFYRAIHNRLQKNCHVFMSDARINASHNDIDIYYYPDLVVSCAEQSPQDYIIQDPKLIIEVLSESTARIDRQQKLADYTKLPSLIEYVLVSQDSQSVDIYRKHEDWQLFQYSSHEDLEVELISINASIPFSEIYQDVM